jgi:hypothetical protein
MFHTAMRRVLLIVGLLVGLFAACNPCGAQTPRWKAHDTQRPHPPVVTPAEQTLPVPPPSDAIVLFDGTDLSQWRDAQGGPAKWRVADGYFQAGGGDLVTARCFGDVQLHIEWASPAPGTGRSQGRGNSGVFLMGLYEVQVLDCYQNETYADGQAGAVYGQYPPLADVSLPPGQWQSFDIFFRRPRFGSDGSLQRPARVTVLHNGVLVQEAAELWGPTHWLQHLPYSPHPDKLPLSLQDHGNPVRFRNVWLRELPEFDQPGPPPNPEPPVLNLPPSALEKYVGQYRRDFSTTFRIALEGKQLKAYFYGPNWIDLVPNSQSEFSMPWTAGRIVFDLGEDGTPQGFTFYLGGEEIRASRAR